MANFGTDTITRVSCDCGDNANPTLYRVTGKDSYTTSRSALAYLQRVYVNVGDMPWIVRAAQNSNGTWSAQIAVCRNCAVIA